MLVLNCGDGPWIIIEAVKCIDCEQQKYWTVFDFDPTHEHFYFPFVTHKEWAETGKEISHCNICNGAMLFATSPCPEFSILSIRELSLGYGVEPLQILEIELKHEISLV